MLLQLKGLYLQLHPKSKRPKNKYLKEKESRFLIIQLFSVDFSLIEGFSLLP